MNYEKAEKRLSDMNEKDILNDNDYEFLDEIGKSDDMCIKCDAADLLINYKTKQAVEILKTLSDDNDATVRASAYDNMWVFEKQDFDEILRKAVSCESDGIARSYAIFSLYDLYLQNDCDTAELIDFMHNLYKRRKTEGVNFSISGTSIFPEKPTNSVRSSVILKIKITE